MEHERSSRLSMLQVFLRAFRGGPGLVDVRSASSSAQSAAAGLWLLIGLLFVAGGTAGSSPDNSAVLVFAMFPLVEAALLFIVLLAGQFLAGRGGFHPGRLAYAAGLTVGVQSVGLGIGIYFVFLAVNSSTAAMLAPVFILEGIVTSAVMLYAALVNVLEWRNGAALWFSGIVLTVALGASIFLWAQLFADSLPEWDAMMFL